MIGLYAFFITWLMGYYAIRCFKSRDGASEMMDPFLAVGVGLGISSQIVFYVLLLSGHIDPVLIIGFHLFVLCLLFSYRRRYLNRDIHASSWNVRSVLILVIILSGLFILATSLALSRPWGEWDGWSFWNYRAHFIFNAGYDWPRLFEFNMQGHHPWMLPLIIIGGWCFAGREQAVIPMAIGIIFTVSTVGLLVTALKKYVPIFWAVLGGVFLASIPFYPFEGTDQYADIETAYFILLSSIAIMGLLKSPTVKNAVWTGLCLGLTAGVKDNSIVAVLLLLILIVVQLHRLALGNLIKPMLWGLVTFGISVVLMKFFESSDTCNAGYAVFLPGLLDWHKWALIGLFSWKSLTSPLWGGLWLLALAVLIVQRARWLRLEIRLLVKFIIVYIFSYFFMFVASALKLEWLLSVSFDRLLFLLAPTVIFVMFHTVCQE